MCGSTDRLAGTWFCPQQVQFVPVMASFLPPSGVCSRKVEVIVHIYPVDSVVPIFHSEQSDACTGDIVVGYYCVPFLEWRICARLFSFCKDLVFCLFQRTGCYLLCFLIFVDPCRECVFSLWGFVRSQWKSCCGGRYVSVPALYF